jgi:ketosteroid isomerase-like protein
MGVTTPDSGLATVRRFNELIGVGDLEGAIALLHPDVVVREPPGLPYGGEYRGRDAFRELTGHLMALAPVPLAFDYFDAGDVVAARLSARFTAASGRSAEVEIVDLFWVRDGLITKTEVFIDDPAAIAALLGEEA